MRKGSIYVHRQREEDLAQEREDSKKQAKRDGGTQAWFCCKEKKTEKKQSRCMPSQDEPLEEDNVGAVGRKPAEG